MAQFLSEWHPPPIWILVHTVSQHAPFKDTPLVHPHSLSIHSGSNCSPPSQAPPLPYLLRSLIFSHYVRTIDLPSICSNTHGLHMQYIYASESNFSECKKDIMTINQCYLTPSVVQAIWETLS